MAMKFSLKALKSVAHDEVESFTSLMNYWGNNYVMELIIISAWNTGKSELKIDFINGKTNITPLMTLPVRQSVNSYIIKFPDFVKRSQSDISVVKKAEMTITIQHFQDSSNQHQKPRSAFYHCKFEIVDDRGKIYSYEKKDWWSLETDLPDKNLEIISEC
jgi:hypothetical protein